VPTSTQSSDTALLTSQPPAALYVHVPYCVSICPYCDFVVVAGSATRGPRTSIPRFVQAVARELTLRADALDAQFGQPGGAGRAPLASLYLGGGTPSLLPTQALAELIGVVRARYGLPSGAEVTVEVNPGPDERGDLQAMRDLGVSRISIGAQSMDDRDLPRLGRRHRAADVAATMAAGRGAAIPSISLDLLYDIPGQSLASFEASLDAALALEPDHVSLYALTLDDPAAEGLTGPTGDHLAPTHGANRWRDRAKAVQDDDRAAGMYELADDRLRAGGLEWYEISNWGRPGHRSRHNLAYWWRQPYEAVGPGAHAFDGRTRRWNAARLEPYLAALDPGDGAPALPPGANEVIEGDLALAEAAILALRTAEGSAAPSVDERVRCWMDERLGPALSAGLVAAADCRLRLTRRGRLLSNEVFTMLLPATGD
jgi:putative oxygen-independent coproporphyrinogen III oxidase